MRPLLPEARQVARALSAMLVLMTDGRAVTSSAPAAIQTRPATSAPDAAIGRLREAIRIRTVSYDEPSRVDASAFSRFREFLEQSYPKTHASLSREVLAGGALLYSWKGRDSSQPPVILLAHQDVVPADESSLSSWIHPPFDGAIAEDQVWGRGALDMKGQLIGMFEAVEALTSEGYVPQRTVHIGLGNDEEASGSGASAIADLLRARGVRAEWVLDEGPMILSRFDLTGKTTGFIGVAEKGYGTLVVTARDRGGHASVPSKSPAVERLARAIVAVRGIRVDRKLDGVTRQTLRALAPDFGRLPRFAISNLWAFGFLVRSRLGDDPAGAALLGTTIAPTMLSASEKENVLPSVATATMNVRLLHESPDVLLDRVRRAIANIQGTEAAWATPPRAASRTSSLQSPGYRVIAGLARRLVEHPILIAPVLVFGATDSRFFHDVATDSYRFQPLVLAADETRTIHGDNERIGFANFRRIIRFYRELIPIAAGGSTTRIEAR